MESRRVLGHLGTVVIPNPTENISPADCSRIRSAGLFVQFFLGWAQSWCGCRRLSSVSRSVPQKLLNSSQKHSRVAGINRASSLWNGWLVDESEGQNRAMAGAITMLDNGAFIFVRDGVAQNQQVECPLIV